MAKQNSRPAWPTSDCLKTKNLKIKLEKKNKKTKKQKKQTNKKNKQKK